MKSRRLHRDLRESEPERGARIRAMSEAELAKIRKHYERELAAAKNVRKAAGR